jgi:hypothetical protein
LFSVASVRNLLPCFLAFAAFLPNIEPHQVGRLTKNHRNRRGFLRSVVQITVG